MLTSCCGRSTWRISQSVRSGWLRSVEWAIHIKRGLSGGIDFVFKQQNGLESTGIDVSKVFKTLSQVGGLRILAWKSDFCGFVY
ncbi:hypothetical protein BN874_140015 [Candidatus Contendobacter odensis Run_B_J11]|uniref:Uncharacterized protein n=1 Tax=Candidatus Contendobacter odensis Run_B_J11 TaxID=1400861 RepID=A0A7U7G8Z4_9GAMM|nr:hypothetical protein BN874_140015 [Candidatus Contendobacter odensis Run_B_J11]